MNSYSDKKEILNENILFDSDYFRKSQINIEQPSLLGEASYFRFDHEDSRLMIWNMVADEIILLSYPELKPIIELKINTLFGSLPIADVYWQNGMLYLVSPSNQVVIYKPESGERREIELDSALAEIDFRAFRISYFPIYVEDNTLFLCGNADG